MESFKYYAFISYSHKDKREALSLYKRLNNYRLPTAIQSEYNKREGHAIPRRLIPIFIDDEEMANTSVMEGMRSGLDRSQYLIVVCSPNSARSEYVNSEVEYFIDHGRGDYIIPYIIQGKPCSGDPDTECYPPAMRHNDRLGADVQALKGDAALRVIATMLKVDMGVLSQREKQRRERRIISVASIIVMLSLLFALYSNLMRGRIAAENLKYRTSLSSQLSQMGEVFEQNGESQEAMALYAEALKTNPSNFNAKMNALIDLQKQGWITATGERLNDDISGSAHADSDGEALYGKSIDIGKYGYDSYTVYIKDQTVTFDMENDSRVFRTVIPEAYAEVFSPENWIAAALSGRHDAVRAMLVADETGLIYGFEGSADGNGAPAEGRLLETIDMKKAIEPCIRPEDAEDFDFVNYKRLYGSMRDGRVLIETDAVGKCYPILYDVFENKALCLLDTEEDTGIIDAVFEKNGNGVALLTKIEPESAIMFFNLRFYDQTGNPKSIPRSPFGTRVPIGNCIPRNIDYSPDGQSLLVCENDSLYIISIPTGTAVCPDLRARLVFSRADYLESGTLLVQDMDGGKTEYAVRRFKPVKLYALDPPEKMPESPDGYMTPINDNLFIENADPKIALYDLQNNVLDETEDVMNLPEGKNDGILWWGECAVDRDSSVAFSYGYLEEVFYRVRYDEDQRKILSTEPIVLPGRNSLDLIAFDDMCAVITSDNHLLGYRNDSSEPFYTVSLHENGDIKNMKWLGNDNVVIEFMEYGDDDSQGGYSIQIWNVLSGNCVAVLEDELDTLMTDFDYTNGILSYWDGEKYHQWILESEDPDEAAIRFVSGLSCCHRSADETFELMTPVLSDDPGNWAGILSLQS